MPCPVPFYFLASETICDPFNLYQGNVVRLFYPKTNMTSQRVSEFLAAIGSPDGNSACS